ncbi:MAG: YbaB/EbfC family nucleoid-associated protein [Alphaproteobacteria bacterium]|nr:YbaB/EbfC family nucleoid-associated protein [Alphaproteobacteria bacterium]MCY4319774.1 YbaB/EbfC family nucleoid-associated protein [Alphaproteobacteria bacterium]
MKNLANMMKQAQEMQEKMAAMQDALADHEVVGRAAAGMVEVRMNAKGELLGLKVDPSLINPAEAEVMEDLIAAGFNDARAKAEEHAREEMRRLTGGLELPPGFRLPF